MTFLQILQRLCAAASLAILATGGGLLVSWWGREQQLSDLFPGGHYAHNPAALWGGLFLVGWSFLGAFPVRLLLGKPRDEGAYRSGEGRLIEAADGARLWVECHGGEHAPALILTHGLGLDSTLWREAKAQLSGRFRVITWDLPGHGRSTMPADGRLSMDRLADELKAVVALASGPAVLVGHSIGGMMLQTLCVRHPEFADMKIAGVVLVNTTHADPVRTTFGARLWRLVEAPLFKPMARLDILLSPLVRLMNEQSRLSGMAHVAMRLGGFGTQPSRRLLDHVTRLSARCSPAVQAKGLLAMMAWDITPELRRIRQTTHVFVGGRDLVTRPAAGSAIAAAILGAFETRVPHAGHLGPIECPSFYDHAIAAFADAVLMKGAVWADRAPARPRDPILVEDRSFRPAPEDATLPL